MTIRFRLLPAGLEEAQFKRAPEGWLFTTASPWIFTRRRTYLVSDAQKPALAARVRRGRYIRLILMISTLLLLSVALIMVPSWLRSRSLEHGALLGGVVVVFTIIVIGSDYLNVRPLLRDLPRSSQKITFGDMLRSQADAMSLKALWILTLFMLVAAAINMVQSVASGENVLAAVSVVVLILMAVAFSGMLVHRLLKQQPDAASAEPTIDALAARLARMERLNHRLSWSLAAVAILALLLMPFLVLTLLQSKLLRLNVQSVAAESLVVRNSAGERVATLFAGSHGMPSLSMYDAQHMLRLNVTLNASGSPYVGLSDAQAKLRATLGLNNNQEPNLLFVDPQEKVRASIGLRGDLPSVWLADAQGKVRAELGLDSKQEPMLKLRGPDGRVQWDTTAGAAKDVPAQK
jgi:hypothetical protein